MHQIQTALLVSAAGTVSAEKTTAHFKWITADQKHCNSFGYVIYPRVSFLVYSKHKTKTSSVFSKKYFIVYEEIQTLLLFNQTIQRSLHILYI